MRRPVLCVVVLAVLPGVGQLNAPVQCTITGFHTFGKNCTRAFAMGNMDLGTPRAVGTRHLTTPPKCVHNVRLPRLTVGCVDRPRGVENRL